jgi:peptidoglycan/LPS O-acetylase OafA/YrhL
MRDYRFDVARATCMLYVIFVHLYDYVYDVKVGTAFIDVPVLAPIGDACMGLFTFSSGYLLGSKYKFGKQSDVNVGSFYKKRILRIFPLFVLSAVVLWLIGLNGTRQTLNGLLCISPFVTPRPVTLWYIPVILFCYAITPIISRDTLKGRIRNCLIVYTLLLVVNRFIPTTDIRLLFNVFFYMVGVISSTSFDWKMNFQYGKLIKILVILFFLVLVYIGQMNDNFHLKLYRRIVGGVGVFAWLFLCEYVSNIFFVSVNDMKDRWKTQVCCVISYISYASMACYMFHRLFFWAGERVFDPSEQWVKWFYMAGIVFPVMLILSYQIQKSYDTIVGKMR